MFATGGVSGARRRLASPSQTRALWVQVFAEEREREEVSTDLCVYEFG